MTPVQEADALTWFPKAYGVGDIDGAGLKGLLGTPNVNPAAVVVRETAQNSWDARGDADQIEFALNVRELGADVVKILRDEVFVGPKPGLGLADLLERESFWALEVSDRGTTGLNGPIRNDVAIPENTPTNFVDFVLNVGAPRDVHLGGGTYGFGKTAAYSASGVGTVLIWSRTLGEGGVESRLIGSAIGHSFEMDSLRYTGRHWWGALSDDGERIEPAVGALADRLGERLFESKFGPDEMGTSILILAPALTEGPIEELPVILKQEVLANLWPKFVDQPSGRDRMDIRVELNGARQSIDSIESDAGLQAYAACLREIRAAQANVASDPSAFIWPVEVKAVRSMRPPKLLGHLAMVRFPTSPSQEKPLRSVALMRNEAELVVKYMERPPIDRKGIQWVGVFKPVPEVDDSFAASEPPAHDDWVPKGMPNKRMKTDVNVALTRVRDETAKFTRPAPILRAGASSPVSGAVAGATLAGLMGGAEGTGATTAKSTGTAASRRGQRAARPRLRIVANGRAPAATLGWVRTWVDLEVEESSGDQTVEVHVTVGVGGGTVRDEETVNLLGWVTEGGGYAARPRRTIPPKETRRYEFEVREDLAADVNARIVDSDA